MDQNDHVFDAGGAADAPPELFPLYTTSGSVTDRSENLSCSSSSSFCYLCSFAGETGMSVDIRAHIRDLSKRGFELPAIARAVAKIYKRDIQPHVEHTRMDGTVRSPTCSLPPRLTLSPDGPVARVVDRGDPPPPQHGRRVFRDGVSGAVGAPSRLWAPC